MKTAIILTYGLYIPERKDLKEYKEYLDLVIADIRSKEVEKVILCGGFTDPKRPSDSEASTVKDYMLQVNPAFTNFVLENKSINSNQNLEFAKASVSQEDEVIVYCDLIRKAKIIWLALHYLLSASQNEILEAFVDFIKIKDIYKDFVYKNITIVSFEREGRSFEETIGQTYPSILDVMSLYNKRAEEADLNQRKKDFGIK